MSRAARRCLELAFARPSLRLTSCSSYSPAASRRSRSPSAYSFFSLRGFMLIIFGAPPMPQMHSPLSRSALRRPSGGGCSGPGGAGRKHRDTGRAAAAAAATAAATRCLISVHELPILVMYGRRQAAARFAAADWNCGAPRGKKVRGGRWSRLRGYGRTGRSRQAPSESARLPGGCSTGAGRREGGPTEGRGGPRGTLLLDVAINSRRAAWNLCE